MRKRWWLAGAIALSLPAAAILAGLGGEAGHEGDVAGRAATYAGRIGLRLPPGARFEYAVWGSGIDAMSRIAFVVPDAGWEAFRAGLPPRPFDAEGNANFLPDAPGWAPGGAAGLSAAVFPWRGAGGGAEVLRVGVAPAGPGERRVFLFWNQM